MSKNSNSVSKFLPLFIFRHNFKQDNDHINVYRIVLQINELTFFIIFLKIAISK